MYPELAKLMAFRSMKHKDIATILNISQQAMSLKLKGKTEFRRSEMQAIKEYFQKFYPGITMDQIFTRDIFLVN
jgi:predicted transcriptional regulator